MAKNVDSEKTNKRAQEIWDEYGPLVKRLCYQRLSSAPQEAEDVISEICLALLNTLYDGKDIEHPKSWLYSVSRNLINKNMKSLTEGEKDLSVWMISTTVINYPMKLICLSQESEKRIL